MLTRLLTSPNFLILAGSVLIGLGGLVATYGWDIRSSEDTRRALQQAAAADVSARRRTILRTLAAEFVLNSEILKDRKFQEPDDAQLAMFVIFPRLQTTAITTAIASGLFASPADNQLFTALFTFQEGAADFNTRLQTTENMTSQNQKLVSEMRKKLRDGKMIVSVRAVMQSLGKVLLANGVDPNERFFQLNVPTD